MIFYILFGGDYYIKFFIVVILDYGDGFVNVSLLLSFVCLVVFLVVGCKIFL